MENLTIRQETGTAFTMVSETFIDQYMAGANDAQIKVYLYLLRCVQGNRSTSISDMADRFNHTEKDILRALSYWEKQKLLSLEFDPAGTLKGICFSSACISLPKGMAPISPEVESSPSSPLLATPVSTTDADASRKDPSPERMTAPGNPASVPEKRPYSPDEIDTFRESEDVEELLFIAEQYVGKPLTQSGIQILLFIYDKLGFSVNLMDYLIQYCVDRGKTDFRYMEKVALSWKENHVTTPEEAKDYSSKYDKTVYTVMRALGKSADPTPNEVTYITKWTKEYGFTLAIIQEACDRTVSATDSHRFAYADRILSNWNRKKIHNLEDIQKADSVFHQSKVSSDKGVQTKGGASRNQFTQFPQRDYNMEELEKELLGV